MRVELLWWEGCPSHPQALADLRDALREEGIDEEVDLRHIASDEEAEREGFPGSPTIRIDGEDVFPPAPGDPLGSTAAATGCVTAACRRCPTSRPARNVETNEGERMSLAIGDRAPDLTLPDTDGTERALCGEGQPSVVVFTCNHCPYALAWHDRILQAAGDYEPRGVRFLAVNPNDAERYPADSLEAMRERVEADGGWPLPYLRDETQEAAREYGAKTTPDVFVLDAEGRLRYRGAPDADHMDPSLNAEWLRDALDALLAGEEPARPETDPVGCSVKWKQ